MVKAEGGRLAALVDDLLDFAALEQGVRRIEPEPVDLARAVREAGGALRDAGGRARAWSSTVDVPDGELVALADAHALSRILANLLSNAWRHGRPSRDGAPGRIRIRAYDDRAHDGGPDGGGARRRPGHPRAQNAAACSSASSAGASRGASRGRGSGSRWGATSRARWTATCALVARGGRPPCFA